MEISRLEIIEVLLENIKKNIVKYLYAELVYIAILSANIYLIFSNFNITIKIIIVSLLLFVNNYISKQLYINISRESGIFKFNKLFTKKYIINMFSILNLKYEDIIFKIIAITLMCIVRESVFIILPVYLSFNVYFKLKNALICRYVNGENINNSNRLSRPSVDYIPNYNFNAIDYHTVNTQTRINNDGEYVIVLYDTNVITKQKENNQDKYEDKKIVNYLSKIKYLYENPEEDLNIIQAKFTT